MTNAKKKVRIKVRAVGQAFGCVGELYYLNGRKAAETGDVFPRGMGHVAQSAAEALAAKLGLEVVS